MKFKFLVENSTFIFRNVSYIFENEIEIAQYFDVGDHFVQTN